MNQYVLALLLCILGSGAMADTVEVEDGLCRYRIEFDGKKYSRQQMQDTMALLIRFNSLADTDHHSADPNGVLRVYAAHEERLNRYRLLPQEEFARVRRERGAQLRFFRDLEYAKALARANRDPALLGRKLNAGWVRQCRHLQDKISVADLLSSDHNIVSAWHNCINQFQPNVHVNENPEPYRKVYFAQARRVKELECVEP